MPRVDQPLSGAGYPSGSVCDPAALLPVLGALGYALTQLATRALGRAETTAAMTFWARAETQNEKAAPEGAA